MFDAFKTTMEMMEDREYFVPQNLKAITYEKFDEKYKTFKAESSLFYVFDHLTN